MCSGLRRGDRKPVPRRPEARARLAVQSFADWSPSLALPASPLMLPLPCSLSRGWVPVVAESSRSYSKALQWHPMLRTERSRPRNALICSLTPVDNDSWPHVPSTTFSRTHISQVPPSTSLTYHKEFHPRCASDLEQYGTIPKCMCPGLTRGRGGATPALAVGTVLRFAILTESWSR